MSESTEMKEILGIGEIPKDWEVTRLGEVVEIHDSKRIPLSEVERSKRRGDYPYCGATGIIDWIDGYIFDGEFVLLAEDGGPFGKFENKAYLMTGKFWVNNHAHVLRMLEEKGINLFLLYLLNFLDLNPYIVGSTRKKLNQEHMKRIIIPLPPLPEQKKIAEILSTVDKAIELTDKIIAQTELLKKGLMQRLLTKGIGHEEFKFNKELGCEIPKEWEVTTIGEVCEVGTGGTPSREKTEYFGGNIPWVKSTEIDYGIITQTEEYITELGLKNSNARIYSAGTLIIAMYGQGVTRGKCAILGIDAAINQACAAIKPKNSNLIHILYLYYWCQYRYEQIRNLGQGANQKNLNLSIVRSIKFPLPPLPEQKRISKILSTVDKKLELERERKQQLQELKKGLMQVLLTGKVRVKVDKNGNPTRETHQNSR